MLEAHRWLFCICSHAAIADSKHFKGKTFWVFYDGIRPASPPVSMLTSDPWVLSSHCYIITQGSEHTHLWTFILNATTPAAQLWCYGLSGSSHYSRCLEGHIFTMMTHTHMDRQHGHVQKRELGCNYHLWNLTGQLKCHPIILKYDWLSAQLEDLCSMSVFEWALFSFQFIFSMFLQVEFSHEH